MKKGIQRPLVRPSQSASSSRLLAEDTDSEDRGSTFKKGIGGAGSAWKAGAVAQVQGDLDDVRQQLAKNILSGTHVIEIDPDLLFDPIGSDRREGWQEEQNFQTFVDNIDKNGQDVPVLVWPKDPNWEPDQLQPDKIEHVQFLLLAGRRRREAAKQLGRKVRAIVAKQDGRSSVEATFNMLVFRFRENDERQDLSAFERLVSIGEMYEELVKVSDNEITATDFAKRLGVDKSIVSRARSVFKSKAELLNAFNNAYEMSYRDIQLALQTLNETPAKKTSSSRRPKAISFKRKVGKRTISFSCQGNKITVKASGSSLDNSNVEGLSDVIALYFEKLESKE